MRKAVQGIWIMFGLVLLFVMHTLAQQGETASEHYSLKVQLDPEERLIFGTATIEYKNDSQQPIPAIYFLLMPNYNREPNPHLAPAVLDGSYWSGFESAWMEINQVQTSDGGTPLEFDLETGPDWFQTYSLKDTLLRVQIPQQLAPGETTSLVIDFKTKFPQITGPDEGFHSEIFTWRFGWSPVPVPASELRGGLYASTDRPYYKSLMPALLYDLELSLPEEYVVAIGADNQTEGPLGESKGQKLVRAKSELPVRSIPISISKQFKTYEFEDDIPITIYYRPGHEANARLLATYAREILSFHQAHFGSYSHKRLVIVESATSGYFGMAADGFVILGGSSFFEKDLGVAGMLDRLTEYLLAHEIAHQWWGIGIGNDLNAQNFLSEAFSEYLAVTYFEEQHGEFGPNLVKLERSGLLEKFIQAQLGYLNLREHFNELPYVLTRKDRFDEAIIKPQQDVRYANYSQVRLYNKGYLVLRALRGLLGHEKMDQLLRTAEERWAHKVLSVEEFERLAEEIAGQDLQEFFDAWLHRDGDPAPYLDYAVTSVETTTLEPSPNAPSDPDRYLVRMFLERKGPIRMPVTVIAVTEADEELQYIYESDRPVEIWEIRTKHPIKEVRLDPQGLTPDANRLNNYFPRRTRVITNGDNDMPLDAYLIRFNPMTRTLEGGFLNDHKWVIANGYIAGSLNLGRGSVATGALSTTGTDLFGLLNISWLILGTPNLGYRGVYWVSQQQFAVTVARLIDAPEGAGGPLAPVAFVGFDYQRSDSVKDLYTVALSARQGFDFTQLSLQALTRLRLWPNVYLDLMGSVGLGLHTRGSFRFALSELASFKDMKGFPFTDRFRWLSYAEVNFPLQREMNYSLLNLAVIDQIDQVFYTMAGRTAPELSSLFNAESVKVEAGLEFRLHGTSLGGLLPFTILLRIGYPFAGTDREEQRVNVGIGVEFQ